MRNPQLLAIGTALPPDTFTQAETFAMCGYTSEHIKKIFMNGEIDTRHFYLEGKSFNPRETRDELLARYERGANRLGAEACQKALQEAGLKPEEIGLIAAASCTGYLCPGLTSRLAKELGLAHSVQQANLLGMGCSGAMPALQRGYDFVKANPGKKALVLAAEICSAAYYFDNSMDTIVGNAICADGAAALVLGNSQNWPGPELIDFASEMFPEHQDKVGFESKDGFLKIVLGREIPELAGPAADQVVGRLLESNGLKKDDIAHWVVHSGGKKVVDKIGEGLGIAPEKLASTRKILKTCGNMSSPTVLFVLKEILAQKPKPGEFGVMLALGPGLSVEAALLKF